jgi:predicted nucleic acid-binding protein
MRRIAIQDANILIDLVNIGLFSHCLALEYEFSTTELIFEIELNEHQKTTIQLHIDSEKFFITKIPAHELLEIQLSSLEDSRLSEQDWSALYYAEKNNALLLSGDKHLRRLSESKGIEVRGILWLFDQLVEMKILSEKETCDFLKTLMKQNRWLPVDECQKRVESWCGE